MDPSEVHFVHNLCQSGLISELQLQVLLENQIDTVPKLLAKQPSDIIDLLDCTVVEYEQLLSSIFASSRPVSTNLAAEVVLSGSAILSTGINKFDDLLNGGLRQGEIIEVFGSSGVGKTQLCLSVAANVCRLPNAMVSYLDLKNDFVPIRFFDLVRRSADALRRIFLVRESKFTDVITILEMLEEKVRAANTILGQNLKLIIIDGLPMAMYPCMNTVGSMRLQLEKLSQHLVCLSTELKIPVMIINHAVLDLSKGNRPDSKVQKSEKPALGKFWAGVPHSRVHLCVYDSPKSKCKYRAALTDSKFFEPGGHFDYTITNAGIV